MRSWLFRLLVASASSLGCARAPAAPLAKGLRCDASAECNRGVSAHACGPLRLCIAGHCEVAADGGVASSGLAICTDGH